MSVGSIPMTDPCNVCYINGAPWIPSTKTLVMLAYIAYMDPMGNIYWLVVFRPTPLKNDGVRQSGWWNSQYDGKNKTYSKHFQTTNQVLYASITTCCGEVPNSLGKPRLKPRSPAAEVLPAEVDNAPADVFLGLRYNAATPQIAKLGL